jgi:hypothetical protein
VEGAVLVRYVSRRGGVPRLAALVFFMDDDVLDTQASVGMPLHYRLKLARLAGWKVNWLRGHGTELWVSVPYLKQKYSEWEPRLVLPSRISPPLDGRRVFYHGSSTHRAEVCWLRPVIEEVLRRDERISFEINGFALPLYDEVLIRFGAVGRLLDVDSSTKFRLTPLAYAEVIGTRSEWIQGRGDPGSL